MIFSKIKTTLAIFQIDKFQIKKYSFQKFVACLLELVGQIKLAQVFHLIKRLGIDCQYQAPCQLEFFELCQAHEKVLVYNAYAVVAEVKLDKIWQTHKTCLFNVFNRAAVEE